MGRACRAQQRGFQRLVHELQPRGPGEEDGDQPSRGRRGSRPHWPRPRRARNRRGWLRTGLVPVRQPRRTSRHQAQARARQGRPATSRLADHLHLRRQEAPGSGHSAGGARRRARPDRRLAANALRIYRGNFDTRLHDRSWLPWPRLLEAIASLPMLVLAGADGGCIPPTLFADARSGLGRRLRSGDPARRGGTSCTSSGRTTWPGRRWNGSCLISDDRLPPIRADPPIDTEMSYPH